MSFIALYRVDMMTGMTILMTKSPIKPEYGDFIIKKRIPPNQSGAVLNI